MIRSRKHHTLANGLLQGKFRLTTLAGFQGLWSLEWFHWNCYRVDPWREKVETINHWYAQNSFCFSTLKLRNYVHAIDDTIVKQVETKDINLNVNPSLRRCNMYFQQVLWNRTKNCLIGFSYKISKAAKLLISLGMGPVSPGLFVKLLQKIIMSQICQKIFWWFISKIWTPTAKGHKMQLFYRLFREKYPRGFLMTFYTHCLSSCVANY